MTWRLSRKGLGKGAGRHCIWMCHLTGLSERAPTTAARSVICLEPNVSSVGKGSIAGEDLIKHTTSAKWVLLASSQLPNTSSTRISRTQEVVGIFRLDRFVMNAVVEGGDNVLRLFAIEVIQIGFGHSTLPRFSATFFTSATGTRPVARWKAQRADIHLRHIWREYFRLQPRRLSGHRRFHASTKLVVAPRHRVEDSNIA